MTFILLSVSFLNYLANLVFNGVGLGVSRAGPLLLYWPKLIYPYYIIIVSYYFSLSLLFVYSLVLWGRGLRIDRVYITLSQPCTADLF